MRTLLITAPLVTALGCDPSGSGGPFEGGDFAFETRGVTDACNDGAFESIFMPDGPTVPNEFASAINVPGDDELPAEYAITLPEPFGAIDVTVTGDADGRTITGAQATGVELDADNHPGCLVDTNISVDLVIDDNDTVHGIAVLTTSSFDEESCPEVQSDPCEITLDLQGTRN